MADFTGPDSMRSIMSGHTPQEAAELLTRLESGSQAAWRAQHEARSTPESSTRFAAAEELDGIRVDAMAATVENGMRRPAEPLAEFTERASRQAALMQEIAAAEDHTYSEREWEDFSAQQQAAWDAEDRQEQAERDADAERFAALPEREQQAEAEQRGWSLAIQREPEAGADREAEAG